MQHSYIHATFLYTRNVFTYMQRSHLHATFLNTCNICTFPDANICTIHVFHQFLIRIMYK